MPKRIKCFSCKKVVLKVQLMQKPVGGLGRDEDLLVAM